MTEPAVRFDLVVGGVSRFPAEAPWARRLVERYAQTLPAQLRTSIWDHAPTLAEMHGEAPFVLIVADPEAFLVPGAARRLLDHVSSGSCDAAIPVTNEPWCEEARGAPPFPYHTPSTLEEGAAALALGDPATYPVIAPRSPVCVVRRQAVAGADSRLELERIPEEVGRRGGRVHVDPGAYLHRYGDMSRQPRTDLAARVPAGSRAVLDVGCARGATAAVLRNAGVRRVVGIEPNGSEAEEARTHCDLVIDRPLEQVRQEFPGEFDAVLFGDVLEHLSDPSGALSRVRPWLSERGFVAATVPHVGHWSVLSDLLEGRFDYIPYSILSGTHIRFFTRRTLIDLFEASGFRIEKIEPVRFAASPAGQQKLARLAALPGASEDLDVVEFLVVARAAQLPV
ncbi:MAG TPA: class I SAM-dependent methyltransferase [Thermoanaerobaculia bacterium]